MGGGAAARTLAFPAGAEEAVAAGAGTASHVMLLMLVSCCSSTAATSSPAIGKVLLLLLLLLSLLPMAAIAIGSAPILLMLVRAGGTQASGLSLGGTPASAQCAVVLFASSRRSMVPVVTRVPFPDLALVLLGSGMLLVLLVLGSGGRGCIRLLLLLLTPPEG